MNDPMSNPAALQLMQAASEAGPESKLSLQHEVSVTTDSPRSTEEKTVTPHDLEPEPTTTTVDMVVGESQLVVNHPRRSSMKKTISNPSCRVEEDPGYFSYNNTSHNNNINNVNSNPTSSRRRRRISDISFDFPTSLCCWGIPKEKRQPFIEKLLHSFAYKALLVVATIIFLFGGAFRFIFLPPSSDTGSDVVFTVIFVFFFIDIAMRVDVEPDYFHCNVCGLQWTDQSCMNTNNFQRHLRGGPAQQDQQPLPQHSVHHYNHHRWCGSVELGSFLFWCDLVSALALIQDISWFSPSFFAEIQYVIHVDAYGIVISGLESINAATPIKPEMDLLVTIAKSLRCARFIRSTTAIKMTSWVNWNAMINAIDPCWWWLQCINHPWSNRYRKSRNSTSTSTSNNNNNNSTTRSRGHHNTQSALTNKNNNTAKLSVAESLLGDGDGELSHPVTGSGAGGGGDGGGGKTTSGAEPTTAAAGTSSSSSMERVTVHHRATPDNNNNNGNIVMKRVRRTLGLLRFNRDEMIRHVAATKIQSAWRRFHYKYDVLGLQLSIRRHDGGLVTNSFQSQGEDRTSVNLSNPKKKRSILTKYASFRNSRVLLTTTTIGASNISPSEIIKRKESQVGTAMRELTGQRVAMGIILALVLTVLFTYTEKDPTRPSTMIVLFNQTGNAAFANKSLEAARASAIPDLFFYRFATGRNQTFSISEVETEPASTLRPREMYNVTVQGVNGTTVGVFAYRNERVNQAWVSLFSTLFIILIWFFGVTAFAGPVMVLVVIPIERMVRLLTMIMSDPLGYENTYSYKVFMNEEDAITKNTRWTKEVLKGMETSFLMSTILRIGSLMKVGFGSAGVEIIRSNLEKGHGKNMLILSSQGSSVACIFLFCDIRQFTDATECLQEEVFVFTNRIAAVVHSICHSYGGSANKNIGDAFLLSWQLDEEKDTLNASGMDNFIAKHNQADKALLSVVKICMALHYDDFYIQGMSDVARDALMKMLAKRKGPIVQMGFGLHAGRAVQGAIGSQRKIDATYVSEHVERAEFLESSTKKYGVNMLMSDSFHRLLHPGNKRRCRKIDQILIEDEDDDEDDYLSGDDKIFELFTFDMDIDSLWKSKSADKKPLVRVETTQESESGINPEKGVKKDGGGRQSQATLKRTSIGKDKNALSDEASDERSENFASTSSMPSKPEKKDNEGPSPELHLPSGPAMYNANVWVSEDMRKIRHKYSDGLFFQKYNSGLQSFYAKDWEHAKQCFLTVLDFVEDGPSRYFLNQIEANNGVPPRDFKGYGVVA